MKRLKISPTMKGIVMYASTLLQSILLFLYFLTTAENHRDINTASFGWSADYGYYGIATNPLLIGFLLVLIFQLVLMSIAKISHFSVLTDKFDESDERDIALKNKFYRIINCIEINVLFTAVFLIAIIPNLMLESYSIGLLISGYFILYSSAWLIFSIQSHLQ